MKFVTIAAAAALVAGPALSFELPDQMAWTAYDTGSAGYNQAVAIGAAMQNATGMSLRVLPGKNDVSRTEPLRQGKVQFSATGVGGSFMAQEGVFEFGAKNWGPQKVRVLVANNDSSTGLAVGVAGDIGVKEYSDLKGKRIAWIKGAPALNINTVAYLAYAGLTLDDVEVVEFGGFGAGWKGLTNGQVDTGFASTNSGLAYEAAAGPRGLIWPPIDPDNAEGIARMRAVAPFFDPAVATVGAAIDGGPGTPTATYAYPVLTAMDTQDEDLVYNMTAAMVELFPEYDGNSPGIGGWALEKQNFEWVVPYHAGAVRYFKERGVWSDAADAHNENLIARQDALAAAWEELKAEDPDDWEAAWGAKRKEALKAGGFNIVF
ncbi:TAXI family TRAP transporter solute-binding subunit [Pikeienuella sp. HZG-20]|uniref:TAXI family TRAP transporter solute-binding subunit n=1 Tax=Paludibacillus litoralis TaxID=3133267 RepID=UPI0030EE1071